MARRPRAEVLEELRLVAEHHLVDARRSRKGREIVAVKHLVFGWISPKEFYAMQEIHRILPKLIEGAYRLKASVFSIDATIGIRGVEIPLPVGVGLVLGAILLANEDSKKEEIDLGGTKVPGKVIALLDLAALVLPFGEIYLLVRLAEVLAAAANDPTNQLYAIGYLLGGLPGIGISWILDQLRSKP